MGMINGLILAARTGLDPDQYNIMMCVNSMLPGHEPRECVDFLIHDSIVVSH
jgi:hypothetical protein